MIIDETQRQSFQEGVWYCYRARGRHDLPWRQAEPDESFDPYKIMVSELMLQQTQVNRVIVKYQNFLSHYPTVAALAAAPLGDVLRAWSGLGYNRRAKFLHQAAYQLTTLHKNNFPTRESQLITVPGIGPATANAILAYAFNQPVVFIETNIRTVYIHHFFNDQNNISEKAIRQLVEDTLDSSRPREWYWALMDYGFFLKQSVGNLNRRSSTYNKQSQFKGSRRQIRGKLIRMLGIGPKTVAELRQEINDERFDAVADELVREGLIRKHESTLSL